MPIVLRPEAARLDPAVRGTLRRLAADPRVGLAVLSGRSLPDIRGRVAVRGILYGGCHGLEIAGPGLRFSHPLARSLRSRIRIAAAALVDVAARFPGARVERKGLGVAVHYRGVSAPRLPPLRGRVKQIAARAGLTILPGKKVWDLLPPGHRGKGKAVGIIRAHLEKRLGVRSSLTVYAGDDATDAEAFRSLGARGLAVQVGGRRGAAGYRLPGVHEVQALLGWIARAVASPPG